MLLITVLVFFAIAVVGAMYGTKYYVRPKEAMDRVVGTITEMDQMPAHPSLAFHDLIRRLGNFVPQSPKDVTVMQRRLIRAGIRREGDPVAHAGQQLLEDDRAGAAERLADDARSFGEIGRASCRERG